MRLNVFLSLPLLVATQGIRPQAATANSFPIRSLCTSNFVSSIELRANGTVAARPQAASSTVSEGIDYCLESSPPVPAPISGLLQQLGGIHQKVAGFFGVPWDSLGLGSGVPITLLRNVRGILGSRTIDRVEIGVSEDWSGGTFSEDVYVHELGHAIMTSDKFRGIGGFPELARTSLAQETLADLLALAISGHSSLRATELPVCAPAIREFGPSLTYASSTAFFRIFTVGRELDSCCHQIIQNPNGQALRDQRLCQYIEAVAPQRGYHEPLSTEDERPFDPLDYLKAGTSKYPPHQVGVPIVGFLLDLERSLNVDAKRMFFAAMSEVANSRRMRERYHCGIPRMMDRGEGKTFSYRAPSLRHVLSAIRSRLDERGRVQFDESWKAYSLDIGMTIADAEASKIAQKETFDKFLRWYRKNEAKVAAVGCDENSIYGAFTGFPEAGTCTYSCIRDSAGKR